MCRDIPIIPMHVGGGCGRRVEKKYWYERKDWVGNIETQVRQTWSASYMHSERKKEERKRRKPQREVQSEIEREIDRETEGEAERELSTTTLETHN